MNDRERAARALYEHEWQDADMPPWPDLPEWLNAEAYRWKADAVLDALLPRYA
jgi:hypothetical protein